MITLAIAILALLGTLVLGYLQYRTHKQLANLHQLCGQLIDNGIMLKDRLDDLTPRMEFAEKCIPDLGQRSDRYDRELVRVEERLVKEAITFREYIGAVERSFCYRAA